MHTSCSKGFDGSASAHTNQVVDFGGSICLLV